MHRIFLVTLLAVLHVNAVLPAWDKSGLAQHKLTKSKEFKARPEETNFPLDPVRSSVDMKPSLSMWNSMTGANGDDYNLAESITDDVYHWLKVNKPAEEQANEVLRGMPVKTNSGKEDIDGLYHAEAPTDLDPQPSFNIHLEPEEDRDHIYHRDPPPIDLPLEFPVNFVEDAAQLYEQPEEDRDHLFHQ